LVGYTPLGDRIGVIPDLGITVTTSAAGPTLSATVSTAVYGTLPVSLEVAVEWWHVSTSTWTEPHDHRFAVTQQAYDDRDRTGTVTLTGLGVGAFLMASNALAGVESYINTAGITEGAATSTTVAVNGSTFTWGSHVFANGDRVHISSRGTASKNLKAGTYFVRNATTNTFQISATANGAIKGSLGIASNVHAERVLTRIIFSGGHSFTRSGQVLTVGGSGAGLSDGTTYYVLNPTATTIQLSSQPNGNPIVFSTGGVAISQVYRNIDGQRIFTNAHPGTVLSAAFLEARARGWGVGPTDMLTHGWTTSLDSTGAAWTSMADDPTTPGVSVGFQPGTPMTTILQFMLDNQYVEWYMAGRIIHAVNYGTGADRTTGTTPVRIGTTASQVPVTIDLTNMRNSIIVRGTGPIRQETDGTPGAWGRLETYVTDSGATNKSLANKQGSTDLYANGGPQIGYSVTEMGQEALYVPGVHYSRGDWVSVQLAGSGWTRLRCIGYTLAKAANGAVTVTTVLQYQKRHLLAKVAKATTGSSAGLTDNGSSTSVLLESDNRKPSAPVITGVTTQGVFAADDTSASTATVTWNGVSADINGGDILTTLYEVWIRPEAADIGTIAGATAGLTLTIPSLPSGRLFAVSVRGQSSTGEWGEFSDEFEFTAAYDTAVPNVPTAPSVTGHLGQARVSWDGKLVDPTLGNTFASDSTQQGFAYVSVWYSTSSGGTYTQIGSNMGNPGAVSISALSIGTTYWFALVATNTLGVASALSTPTSYLIVGVTGPDLVANSVTANTIAAGAITADKLDVGTVPQGTPQDRVPMPLTQTSFWSVAVTGSSSVYAAATGATAVSTGITLAANGLVWVTQKLADAPSSYIYLQGLATTATATFYVREWSGPSTFTDTAVALSATGSQYKVQATTINYAIYVLNTSGTTAVTVEAAHVTEALGSGYNYEGATIQPDGLRIYSGENPNPILALTSSSNDVLAMSTAAGDQIASIDSAGNAGFTSVTSTMASFDGVPLVLPSTDSGFADTLSEANPNNGDWVRGDVTNPDGSQAVVALLDRLGRGVVYTTTWPSQNASVIASGIQYQRIAKDSFMLEHGRDYEFNVGTGLLRTNNTSGADQNLRLFLQLTPFTSVAQGTTIMDSIVYAGAKGAWSMIPVVFTAATGQGSIDVANRRIPAGVTIYWQLATIGTAAATANWTWNETGSGRGLMVIDLGSSYLTRPLTGYDTLLDVHDYTSNVAGGSTGGSSSSKTVTATATWSRSYNNSGAGIINSGGQWGNPNAIYQGNGATPEGAQWGFSAGFLSQFSGKTVTSAQIYLKNAYMAYSGSGTARIGSHSASSATSTIGNAYGANEFGVGWTAGSGKWVSLPSSMRSGLSSGSVKGFQVGVSSSNTDYMYFEGVGYGSHPPQLKVTYS
jgi:hypothetical protein